MRMTALLLLSLAGLLSSCGGSPEASRPLVLAHVMPWFEADPAKEICALCPVRTSCLEHALAVRERDGVWGGATERERRRLIRQRRRTA